jgi:hypothetical protein
LATKREVEAKLRELIRRLDRADTDLHGSLAESLPEGRIIEVVLPDIRAAYWTQMAEGRMGKLHTGRAARRDIRIEAESDHLVELIDGTGSLVSSFLSGRVKIDASLSDIIRLRKLT